MPLFRVGLREATFFVAVPLPGDRFSAKVFARSMPAPAPKIFVHDVTGLLHSGQFCMADEMHLLRLQNCQMGKSHDSAYTRTQQLLNNHAPHHMSASKSDGVVSKRVEAALTFIEFVQLRILQHRALPAAVFFCTIPEACRHSGCSGQIIYALGHSRRHATEAIPPAAESRCLRIGPASRRASASSRARAAPAAAAARGRAPFISSSILSVFCRFRFLCRC
jgi:hypothetical protein